MCVFYPDINKPKSINRWIPISYIRRRKKILRFSELSRIKKTFYPNEFDVTIPFYGMSRTLKHDRIFKTVHEDTLR